MSKVLDTGLPQYDSIRRNVEGLERTARHMTQLISDLIDAARIQAGGLAVELRECPVETAVAPSIETAQMLANERGIEFVPTIASNPPPVNVDRSRITQILDNLIGNALKFTPEGGRITLAVEQTGNSVRFSVEDSGPGIPPEALSHIFEAYWQVSKTRTGMGLGLFIAKTFVEAHGGKIWVDSLPGEGTTFYITLPLSQPSVNPKRAA